MNIGILQCGRVRDKFSEEHGQYPDMFVRFLKQVEPDLNFSTYDAENGQFPKDLDESDAYLISGSRHCVNDGYTWIEQLEEFVRQAQTYRKKVIGICFGHQIIAKALGGKVIAAPNGWGVGMSVNQITQHKPWMTPKQEKLNLLVSHQDQVVELPLGAEVLASSDFCPFYMFQLGDNFITVQGHPEFSKAYSQALIEDRAEMLGKELSEKGLASLQLPLDDRLFATWLVNFLKS